jgi:hypothetical protein
VRHIPDRKDDRSKYIFGFQVATNHAGAFDHCDSKTGAIFYPAVRLYSATAVRDTGDRRMPSLCIRS